MNLVIDIPDSIYQTIENDEFISREQLAVLQMHILKGSKPMTQDKLNEITTVISDAVEDFLDMEKHELLNLLVSLHNELYKEVTGEYYDYMYQWANLGYGGSPDDAMFKSFKDESTTPV